MWNWNRDFLKPKPGDQNKPKRKINEQSFRTSIKESDQIKNTSLFVANVSLLSSMFYATFDCCTDLLVCRQPARYCDSVSSIQLRHLSDLAFCSCGWVRL